MSVQHGVCGACTCEWTMKSCAPADAGGAADGMSIQTIEAYPIAVSRDLQAAFRDRMRCNVVIARRHADAAQDSCGTP